MTCTVCCGLQYLLSLFQAGDALEDTSLTVCTGTDMVNLMWTTFVFDSSSKAQVLIAAGSHYQ